MQNDELMDFHVEVVPPENAKGNTSLRDSSPISIIPLPIVMNSRLSFDEWLGRCNFAYIPPGLTPRRMEQFMTYPFSDQETRIPGDTEVIVGCRLNRPATGHEIVDIRMARLFYRVNFDHMLATVMQHPGFFEGRNVLNVDLLLEDDCGVKSIAQIVTGETEGRNRYREFRLADPDAVWPAGTFFLAHTNPNPGRKIVDPAPVRTKKKHLSLLEILRLRNLFPQNSLRSAESGA